MNVSSSNVIVCAVLISLIQILFLNNKTRILIINIIRLSEYKIKHIHFLALESDCPAIWPQLQPGLWHQHPLIQLQGWSDVALEPTSKLKIIRTFDTHPEKNSLPPFLETGSTTGTAAASLRAFQS